MKTYFLFVGLAMGVTTPSVSVMLCRGSFSVRQSVCSGVNNAVKDLTPSETLRCTDLGAPAAIADVFDGKATAFGPAWDFSNPVTVRNSLNQMSCEHDVDIFFDDCENHSALPNLVDGTEYMALVVVDIATAASAKLMTNAANINTDIKYLDLTDLANSSIRNELKAKLDSCQSGPCLIQFSVGTTDFVTKPGYLSFDI